jgi:hypothetical protein
VHQGEGNEGNSEENDDYPEGTANSVLQHVLVHKPRYIYIEGALRDLSRPPLFIYFTTNYTNVYSDKYVSYKNISPGICPSMPVVKRSLTLGLASQNLSR